MENVILIYLAKNNKINLLQKILKDSINGNTPLIWAAKNDNFLMCKLLIDAGADWCIFNKQGKSFIDYLGKSREHILNIYGKKYNIFLKNIKSNL